MLPAGSLVGQNSSPMGEAGPRTFLRPPSPFPVRPRLIDCISMQSLVWAESSDSKRPSSIPRLSSIHPSTVPPPPYPILSSCWLFLSPSAVFSLAGIPAQHAQADAAPRPLFRHCTATHALRVFAAECLRRTISPSTPTQRALARRRTSSCLPAPDANGVRPRRMSLLPSSSSCA